jgi:hypothetical protein
VRPDSDVTCDVCRSHEVSRVWTDALRITPVIFECTNAECPRREFRVMRLRGAIRHVGVPGEFKPRRPIHSAIMFANRSRAMEGLPPLLRWAIDNDRLIGVGHV